MKKFLIIKAVSVVALTASILALNPFEVSAKWIRNSNNTWCYNQNQKNVTGWKKISNRWYYFDVNGKMDTGWICTNGNWYYNNNSGAMQTGWVKDKNKWYYMEQSGKMVTGWILDRGTWYFANKSGEMQTGVLKIDGKIYYFNNSGAMQTGYVNIQGITYRFNSNGQSIGSRIPKFEKEFDKKGNLITNQINDDTQIPNDNTNTDPVDVSDNNQDSEGSDNSTGENDSTGGTGTVDGGNDNANTGTPTNNENTQTGNTNVNGLPTIPTKYSTTIQSSAEEKILELMNAKRREAGLNPLTMDNTLRQVARYKSNHMIQYNYFDHTNPDGTNWTSWLKTIGYRYTATAENIAYNSYDPVELFNQWWNSAGHRQNMMNPSYTKVGIGVLSGNGKHMGTQTFSN